MDTIGTVILGIGAIVLSIVLFAFLSVFPFMLLLGAVHSFLPIIPALGFVHSLLLALLISTTGAIFSPVKSS